MNNTTTTTRILTHALALAVLVLLVGCRQTATKPALPTVTMQIGSKPFTLEVANTLSTRERGLMQRDSMPAGHGMIFVFDNEDRLGFYMKNTRIPLDIVFVNAAGVVVSIKQMKPYDLKTTYTDAPAKWAIELNAGAAAGAGLKVGDALQIPDAARSTAADTAGP
jgi:uncharacterized membrane protein (UPF0127 family)